MDMLSTKPPSPPSRLGEWPNSRAQRGKFYGVNDPVFQMDQLCVMTMDTWTDVGTLIKKNEEVMRLQNGRIIELKAANDALAAQLRDANERLKNLRRVRRKELRADLEKLEPELAAADTAVPGAPVPQKFF
jgi:hypothetical protein